MLSTYDFREIRRRDNCTFLTGLNVNTVMWPHTESNLLTTWGADKSLARPGRKQATATEDFYFHVSYL